MIFSQYNLKNIIRCHSFEEDVTDNCSQIWDLKFEPIFEKHFVASIGQDVLNIINLQHNQLEYRFKCPKRNGNFEELYTLAWAQVQYRDDFNQSTYLFTMAGLFKCIYVIQPSKLSWQENLFGHSAPIKALCFHPIRTNWLFSGDMTGHIMIWDIAFPTLNRPRIKSKKIKDLKTPLEEDISQMCVIYLNDILLVSTSKSIYGWDIHDDKKLMTSTDLFEGPSFRINIPTLPEPKADNLYYFRICIISQDLIAVKSCCDSHIYILVLNDSVLFNGNYSSGLIELRLIAKLSGNTDIGPNNKLASNYGFDDFKNSCTYLAIGNDHGEVIVYDLTDFVNSFTQIPFHQRPLQNVTYIAPLEILKWEKDLHLKAGENESLPDWETLNKTINCVSISPDGNYIVAGMACNLITSWKKDN